MWHFQHKIESFLLFDISLITRAYLTLKYTCTVWNKAVINIRIQLGSSIGEKNNYGQSFGQDHR